MSQDNLGLAHLISLYNGAKSIAERSDVSQLRHLHMHTNLDKRILDWLNNGEDVILTGNPGDGKTHLLMFLELPQNVEWESDASQKTPEDILKVWRKCRKRKHSFVLAINHAPLRHLAKIAAEDPDFKFLYEMIWAPKRISSPIDNFVIYSDEQEAEFSKNNHTDHKVKVVDLSQRELLTDEIIGSLLNKLCTPVASASCVAGIQEQCGRCPLHDNATALSNPSVQRNLSFMLTLVARRGFHTTMRDLLGLLAYILTGGITCEELWQKNILGDSPKCNDFDYYNLLFDGRSPLFDAIRRTFDPGRYSDPNTDLNLWSGEILSNWLIPRSTGHNPLSKLSDLRSAKRRYFFEFNEGIEKKYQRMMTSVGQEFDRLLNNTDAELAAQDLVEMINLFYAPLSRARVRNYRDRLYLWNQHRYSIGQPPGYIAMRSLGVNSLRVYHPRLNPIYDNAVSIRQDHVLLAVQYWLPGDPSMRIDWEMYKALWDAKQGKAIEVQSYSILRRLDLFLRSLSPTAGDWAATENIIWGDYKRHSVVSIRVNRAKSAYQE